MSAFQRNVPSSNVDPQGVPNATFWGTQAMRGDPDGGTQLVYVGLARPGSAEGSLVWQIRKLAYDGNGNVISVTFPSIDNVQAPTNLYQYSWTGRAGYTYS